MCHLLQLQGRGAGSLRPGVFRPEQAQPAPLQLLRFETGLGFGQSQAVDLDYFMTGFAAAEERDGAAGQAEFFRQKLQQCIIGAAFKRGCMDLDLERVAQPAGDLVARSVGDGLKAKGAGRHTGRLGGSWRPLKAKHVAAGI